MMQGLDLDLAELAPLQLKASRLLHRDKPFGLVVVQGGVVSRLREQSSAIHGISEFLHAPRL